MMRRNVDQAGDSVERRYHRHRKPLIMWCLAFTARRLSYEPGSMYLQNSQPFQQSLHTFGLTSIW